MRLIHEGNISCGCFLTQILSLSLSLDSFFYASLQVFVGNMIGETDFVLKNNSIKSSDLRDFWLCSQPEVLMFEG